MKQFYLLPILVITPLFGQSLQPPTFSHESGFYNEEFQLNLTHEDPEVQIIYTLDGSEPNINNLNGRTYQYKKRYPQFAGEQPYEFFENTLISNAYENPILVYNRSSEPNRIANISTSFKTNPYFPNASVDKSFVVRAKAYGTENSSETVTHVYYFNEQAYTLPIVNITTDDEKLFGYENGLFVAGKLFDRWRLENPTLDAYDRSDANYWASGSESEIEVNFIYLDQRNSVINQNLGLRLHGNGTRFYANRSHRLYAKSSYGKSTMNYGFFKNYHYESFKRLILRNSGQDTEKTLFRDALIQGLNAHLNMETQNYTPVINFVNGEYYGIYNLRERFDEKYFERVFGIEEEEVDFLENDGIVDLGDDTFYQEMIRYFKTNDLSIESNYQQALTYVDEVNVADYHIAEIYAANFDWPHNNMEYFRKRTMYNPEAPYGQDGRFRWLFKDLDLGFNGMPEALNHTFMYNALENAVTTTNYENETYVNYVLKGLLDNENFKKYFINRFADLLNTSYKPERVNELINEYQDVLRPEMTNHIRRWNLIPSLEAWENEVETLREFARRRIDFQRSHIMEYFNLDGFYNLTLQTEKEKGFIKTNTIEINENTIGIDSNYDLWTGQYFYNVPVKIEAVALPGYKFLRWEGDTLSYDPVLELNIDHGYQYNIHAIFELDELSTGDLDKVDFLVYPNPTADVLNIASASTSEIKFSISNMLGQQLEAGITKDQTLNVSHLAKGVYLIELNQDQKRVVKKFIKK